MDINLNGVIKSGSIKSVKINQDKVFFYQFNYTTEISEEDFSRFSGNGAKVSYEIIPFPFNRIDFPEMKCTVNLFVTALDDEGDEVGEEKEYVDVKVKKYSFINKDNVPTLSVDFMIPTSKNLIESIANIDGKTKLIIRMP